MQTCSQIVACVGAAMTAVGIGLASVPCGIVVGGLWLIVVGVGMYRAAARRSVT